MHDLLTKLASNLAVTSATVVGDAYDLKSQKNIGTGTPMFARVQVVEAFSGGTSLNMQTIISSAEALNADVRVLNSSGEIPVAELGLGAVHYVALTKSPRGVDWQRFLGLRLVPTGTFTTGRVTAHVVDSMDDNAQDELYETGRPM